MDKKGTFYGTPLSRSLDEDNDGPINSRRARSNYQQTVRDDQGRQRFHGAFTGGFSAGYFNTVDSVEGFQPRQFVAHRGTRRQDGNPSKFSHKPEDYMDEEDLGEFGIAPKKIRINSYKPLKAALDVKTAVNPLTAVLGTGRRLKISGEAFGSGVLDDNDEDFLDTYGYDEIGNYNFKASSSSKSKQGPSRGDDGSLSSFVLARGLSSMKISVDDQKDYLPPTIPDDWRMPVRNEPYIPPTSTSDVLKLHQSGSLFTNRFTSGSEPIKSDDIQNKAGLVLYSDLKLGGSSNRDRDECRSKVPEKLEPTIHRQQLEWRPCSLLCKHFNVPNPYPDNSFCGVRPSNLIVDQHGPEETSFKRIDWSHPVPASLELKRSIFNVAFSDHSDRNEEVFGHDETDSENEPQVLEVSSSTHVGKDDGDTDEDQDILIVAAPRQEPEVIVLSSSSSSPRSVSLSPSRSGEEDIARHETGEDSYGPPLPPTLKTLIDSDHRRSRRGKKHKKHRKRNA